MSVTLSAPWLDFDLGDEMQVLSFAPHRPGAVTTRRILWREVRNADLTPELDAPRWLAGELAARRAEDAVCFLTSRQVARHLVREGKSGAARALAVATVGLSNAERVGRRMPRPAAGWGTINIALRLRPGLAPTALLEAMTIVAQARTAAMLDAGHEITNGRATGTGTDCIAVAAPDGAEGYAGLHTDVGEAVGRAAYAAVLDGARDWLGENAMRDRA